MLLKTHYKFIILFTLLASGTLVLTQNCGSTNSFSAVSEEELQSVEELVDPPTPPPVDPLEGLKVVQALVYGSSSDDRDFLARKIAGYTAPGLKEIFNNWQRMSHRDLYSNGNITPESDYNFCFTGIDPVTGNWKAGKDDTGAELKNPGTSSKCYGSSSFTASSWIYLEASQRLRCPTNSSRYIGFLSALKFDNYVHQAALTSATTDDDSIALIIAAKVDEKGSIHTLSAIRSHGDLHSKQNALGWAIVYRKNGGFVAEYGSKSVGGIFPRNGTVKVEDGGWNGRMTLVKVERNGDLVKASTSIWGTDPSKLKVSAGSVIQLDLNDSTKPELAIFRGPQSYGYATLSQAGAEFLNISFTTQTDDKYVYDLRDKKVYEQQANGSYIVKSGADPFVMLEAPVKAGNIETQKIYHLKVDKTFELLD